MYFSVLSGKRIGCYHGDHTAGPDAVCHSHHVLVVRVFSSPQEVLVAHEVGALIDHEAAALHPDGVAAVEEGVKVRAVAHTLMKAAAKLSVLVEDNLSGNRCGLFIAVFSCAWLKLLLCMNEP